MRSIAAFGIILAATGTLASGQSLFLVDHDEPRKLDGTVDSGAHLRDASLIFHEPPPPRQFAKHDIVTIIVDESTSASSSQSLETTKESERRVRLDALLDLQQFLEARVRQNDTNVDLIDISAESEFTGEGDYDRQDRFSARITATVLEVKPNGTLVLEASKTISKDEEVQHMVLSGLVRQDDVTGNNTVLSSQMADLTVVLNHQGEVRKAAKKGLITRVLDTLFAF